MSKRIAQIVLFLFVIGFSYGQTFSGSSNTYLHVYSYDGAVSIDAFRLRFEYTGDSLNVPNWKISMRVKGPIVSSDGKVFPSEKISLVAVRTEGQANPGPLPTLSEIGVRSPVALDGLSEVFLVPYSNEPLYNVSQYSTYYDLNIIFNLVVAGGGYLADLHEYRQFVVPFQFTAYRGDNTVIGVYDQNYTIQVHRLTGDPPPDENQYSIRVSTEASNGLLEFKTMADYLNGKSVTYTDGLSVSATTAYQVTVRSIPAHFSSAVGNTLPLDVVRLQLTGGAGTMAPVALSTDTKTILQGLSTNGASQHFDITYSTEANDARLFNVPSDHYTTSLMYEISPR
jgi:hypothetical protein